MGTENLKELQKNFFEKISEEVAKFFSNSQALKVFENSEGNFCYCIKEIRVENGMVEVMATFIKVSDENYKCKLQLHNFPDLFGWQKLDLENKYEGKLFLFVPLKDPKFINVII